MALFKTFRGRRTDLDNVAKIDGHAYFCMDDGTFWIDYKDLDEVKRKQINKDDWNEDIKNAIAALKAEIEAELASKTDYLGTVSSIEELSTIAGNGDYHRVAAEFQFGDDVAHVGDILISLINLPAQNPECWDLIHIGESIQVDYNQNDETAPDYIKNRPFYTEVIKEGDVTPIELTILESGGDDSGGYFVAEYKGEITLESLLTIELDGKVYKNLESVYTDQESIFWGNPYYIDETLIDNGIPFVFVNYLVSTDSGADGIITCEIYSPNPDFSTFKIYAVQGSIQIKKLDAKYLPDGLATESYVNEKIGEIEIPPIPTNYITTDTDQTNLKGTKTWKNNINTFTFSPVNDKKISSHLYKSIALDEYGEHLDYKEQDFSFDLEKQEIVLDSHDHYDDGTIDNYNKLSFSKEKIGYENSYLEGHTEYGSSSWSIGQNGFITKSTAVSSPFDSYDLAITSQGISFKYYDWNQIVGEAQEPLCVHGELKYGDIATKNEVIKLIDESILHTYDMIIFDGGDADVTLAVLDNTELE